MGKSRVKGSEIATNRKAVRDYHISDKYEAGLELKGTEVKSIRAGKINVADAFARVEGNQVMLYGCDIQPWETAGEWYNHQPKRPRRLLLPQEGDSEAGERDAGEGGDAAVVADVLEEPPGEGGNRRGQGQDALGPAPGFEEEGGAAGGAAGDGPIQPPLRGRGAANPGPEWGEDIPEAIGGRGCRFIRGRRRVSGAKAGRWVAGR